MRYTVYIGVGSNLDLPLEQVKTAIRELDCDDAITVDKTSNIYKSKALETNDTNASGNQQEQHDYINAVVRVKTNYEPLELLGFLQALELSHHRVKEYRWGPRTLDLDILLFDDLVLQTEKLTIPHIELINRDFVLYPLNDIEPELDIIQKGKLKSLLMKIPNNLVLIEKY